MSVEVLPWYADIVNYLITGQLPEHWTKQDKDNFFAEIKNFFWDDPYLFKYYADQIVRRYVPKSEFQNIISFCYEQACGGHFSAKKTTIKILQCGTTKLNFSGRDVLCMRYRFHGTLFPFFWSSIHIGYC